MICASCGGTIHVNQACEDCGIEYMEMLNAINIWETLRLTKAFSDGQKEDFKDPFGDWHIEKLNDTSYLLYYQQKLRSV